MRRQLVMGNWKMNGSQADNAALLDAFCKQWIGVHQAEVVVCPPLVYLSQVNALLENSNILVGAQDVSAEESGAYTGDVSAKMLSDIGCRYVLVGHSERRELRGDSNELIAEKFAAAQRENLIPVLCVGETLAQRDADQTLEVIGEQLKAVSDRVGNDAFSGSVVAYEPVWAIGTGRTATPEQAQEVHEYIRAQLGSVGGGVRILYGGSVKPDSAPTLFSMPDIDGGLIGGASLKADDFYKICQAAE